MSFLGVLPSILPADDPSVSKQGAIKIVFTEYMYVNTIKHSRVSNFKIYMKSFTLIS